MLPNYNKIEIIKKLRETTGMGLSECRKALDACSWDLEKATEHIKVNVRESDKPVGAGAVFSYVHHNFQIGALLELHCGTDFVARSDDFQKLGNMLVMHVAALAPNTVEELLSQDCLTMQGITLDFHIKSIAARFNEPVKVARFQRYVLGAT